MGEAAQAARGDAVAAREAVLAAHPRFGELTQVQASVFVQCLGSALRPVLLLLMLAACSLPAACNPAAIPSVLHRSTQSRLLPLPASNASITSLLSHFLCPLFRAPQKYGELTPAAPKTATGSSLASSMAQLTVCHNGKTLAKKLPGRCCKCQRVAGERRVW